MKCELLDVLDLLVGECNRKLSSHMRLFYEAQTGFGQSLSHVRLTGRAQGFDELLWWHLDLPGEGLTKEKLLKAFEQLVGKMILRSPERREPVG